MGKLHGRVRLWAVVTVALFAVYLIWDGLADPPGGYYALWGRLLTGRESNASGWTVLDLTMFTLGLALIVSLVSWAICAPAWTVAVRLLGQTKATEAADYDDPPAL
jgi:hypothetical protein